MRAHLHLHVRVRIPLFAFPLPLLFLSFFSHISSYSYLTISSMSFNAQIFPAATRAKGSAWSSFAFGVGNGAVVMVVPLLIKALTFYIFIIFAACNFVIIPLVYYFYPETARRVAVPPFSPSPLFSFSPTSASIPSSLSLPFWTSLSVGAASAFT